MSSELFTGYDPSIEDRDALYSGCIDYDFSQFFAVQRCLRHACIMDKMLRQDQYRMNSCGGLATGVHGGQVTFWLQTGKFRRFNGHWSYRRGQELDGKKTDSGVSIRGVVEAAKRFGLLPEDIDDDGHLEFPYPLDDYHFQYPQSAAVVAAQRKVGYSGSERIPGKAQVSSGWAGSNYQRRFVGQLGSGS